MKVNYLESRHVGLTEADEKHMLDVIGAESIEQLVRQTMPADCLCSQLQWNVFVCLNNYISLFPLNRN